MNNTIEKSYNLTELGPGEHTIQVRARSPENRIEHPQSFMGDSNTITGKAEKIATVNPLYINSTFLYFKEVEYATHFQLFYTGDKEGQSENYIELGPTIDGNKFISVEEILPELSDPLQNYYISIVLHAREDLETSGLFIESDESKKVKYVPKIPLPTPKIYNDIDKNIDITNYWKIYYDIDAVGPKGQGHKTNYFMLYMNGKKIENCVAKFDANMGMNYINISKFISGSGWIDNPIIINLQALNDGHSSIKEYTKSLISDDYLYYSGNKTSLLLYNKIDENTEVAPIGNDPETENNIIMRDNSENILLGKTE